MNTEELRQKTVAELQKEILALLKEQFNLRMQKGTGQLTRTDQLGKVRRAIARAKTILKEKQGEANE